MPTLDGRADFPVARAAASRTLAGDEDVAVPSTTFLPPPNDLMPSLRRSSLLLILAGVGACGLLVALVGPVWESQTDPRAGAAPVDASAVAHRMLRALVDVDYAAFVAPTGGNLKKLPEDAFLRLVMQHGARLRGGYELRPIDTTVKRDVEMTRWRVVFTTGGRDATLTLGTSGGTVRLFTLW